MKKIAVILAGVLLSATALAAGNPTDALGVHNPIFHIEKNVNPQNIMVAYSKVSSACELTLDENKAALFDFYWLMDGLDYKPVHPMIKSEIRNRLSVSPGSDARTFYASVNDLKELDTDLKDARMTIRSRPYESNCVVEAFMTLGPSDNNAVIKVTSIYTEGKGTLRPKVVSVTIKGISVQTGAPISRTYKGK